MVGVELDNERWNHLLHLKVLFHDSIGRVWDIIHDHVEVHLIWLVSVSIEALPHFHAVRVMQHLQDSQLPVFVSFVLENFLDGHSLTRFRNSCLKDNAKGSISDDFFSVVGHTLRKYTEMRRLFISKNCKKFNEG